MKGNHLEELDIDGSAILKTYLKETGYEGMDWIHVILYRDHWAAWDSVVGIATGWIVRGSNPSGGKIFRTHPY
jgi:hypothetical protein